MALALEACGGGGGGGGVFRVGVAAAAPLSAGNDSDVVARQVERRFHCGPLALCDIYASESGV